MNLASKAVAAIFTGTVGEEKFTIGIDLGTSNCAVAYSPLGAGKSAVEDFPIPQVQRAGQTAKQQLLPSLLYAPTSEELASGGLALPWNESGFNFVVGQFARWRGSKVPGRVVSSAKSWLSHSAVDRSAAILPWGGAADVAKISPVYASALLLRHIRAAWNLEFPETQLQAQEVVITVPGSFDEAARSLTVSAAKEAGIEKFTLLEEPQAAFYDFSRQHLKKLSTALKDMRLVLVVDVGGGTTDFTLVQVEVSPDGPLLRRIAVGDHLILGGDNMDNALARQIEENLSGKKLTPGQWIQLVHSTRDAKEKLLEERAPSESRIAIASEGSQLLGKTISKTISRSDIEKTILDGFFPKTLLDEFPVKSSRAGIQELGLPFASDPAIPRHLSAFLAKHAAIASEALGIAETAGPPRPDAVLLNGGVFNSPKIAERLLEVLSSWWPNQPPIRVLQHGHLDLAVARGAAYYGLVRHGMGRRISGGTAHSFFLGIASEAREKSEAVCLIPRGMEEGHTVELKDRMFKLHLGRPVQFPLYTSTADQLHKPGQLVAVSEEFQSLPPIHALLKSNKQHGEKIPVFVRSRLTEIGTVEISCVAAESTQEWRLEFDIRGAEESPESNVIQSLHPKFQEARTALLTAYGNKPGQGEKTSRDAKQLWPTLERLLGSRDSWNLATLRQITAELQAGAARRRRSADHEKVFFQLLGYSLRPGYGYPLDEWRSEQTYKLFTERVEFHKEKPNWNEFWILWRRIAGGLKPDAQIFIWEYLKPYLSLRIPSKAPKDVAMPKGIQPEGIEEMVRAAASLEHILPEEKTWFGNLICERLADGRTGGGPWTWALGRLGARVPLYGSAHNTVPPEIVEHWIDSLLKLDIPKVDGAPFAAAQMARLTGDRLREISPGAREAVAKRLDEIKASENWIRMLREVVELKSTDQARVFGDTLPIGLQLVRN